MRRITYFATALFIAGCGTSDQHNHTDDKREERQEDVSLSAEQESIAGIETQRVSRQRLQHEIVVPGTINSNAAGRALVTPPVAGRVLEIKVALGESVQKGQVLATLESTELAEAWTRVTEASRFQDEATARVIDAETQVRLAAQKLMSARQTLDRQKALAKMGAFSQAPLQQAQSEVNEAESDLASAQNEQASHAEQLRRMENLFRDGIVSKSEYDAALLEAQQDVIRVNRARARVQVAKTNLDRERKIAERGLLNSKEVQTAEAEVRSARIEVERAQGAVKSTRVLLVSANRSLANVQNAYRTYAGGAEAKGGRVSLHAPIGGTITHLAGTRGQTFDRTDALFEIDDLTTVWVVAQVPEREVGAVRKGMPVTVTAEAIPGAEFHGQIDVVDSSLDPKSRSLAVRCRLTNQSNRLKPEMFTQVRIAKGETRLTLAVPRAAIVTDGGRSFLYVKNASGFARTEVRTGTQTSDLVEVLSGIDEGAEIAVSGGFILKSEYKKEELKGHEH